MVSAINNFSIMTPSKNSGVLPPTDNESVDVVAGLASTRLMASQTRLFIGMYWCFATYIVCPVLRYLFQVCTCFGQ